MKESVKVSIITVCYNSERTIRKTIEHVLHQSYENIEYVLVDGGSQDTTVSIIQEYEKAFNGRLRYVSEKDDGIYDAMNKGIKMASGELIGISNSDDWLELDAVEIIVKKYQQGRKQIIYGFLAMWKNMDLLHRIVFVNHECLKEENIPHPACFVTKSAYESLGLYNCKYKLVADYEFMLRAYSSGMVEFVPIESKIANFTEGGASSNIKCDIELAHLLYEYGCISKKKFIKRLVVLNMKKLFQRFKFLG